MSESAMTDAFIGISQVKARYCRMVDTKDWDGLANLFTDDIVLDVQGADPIHGKDKVMAYIKSVLADARTAHHIHLPEIELQGDDKADVIWAMQDRNTWDPPRNGVSIQRGYGQYHEHYVKVDGQWKIAREKLVYLHVDFNTN